MEAYSLFFIYKVEISSSSSFTMRLVDWLTKCRDRIIDTSVQLVHQNRFGLGMIDGIERLWLICEQCQKPMAVVRAWPHCRHCNKPLLELAPSNLPLITYRVDLSSEFHTEEPEPH